MKASKVEVFALKIGQRSVSTSLVMYHTDPTLETVIYYFFWCVRYQEKIILVDTGFRPEIAEDRGLSNVRHPIEQLAKLGIHPDMVEIVICTHLHWDHAGGCDFFKNATFFVPERDLRFFTGPAIQYDAIRHFVYPQDLNSILKLSYDGRVKFVDGNQTIFPGIAVHAIGGHTPGLHVVSVETSKGKAVLASDICYLYRNINEGIIPGLFVDLMESLRGLQRLQAVASNKTLIFPSHDPELCSRFESTDGEVIRII